MKKILFCLITSIITIINFSCSKDENGSKLELRNEGFVNIDLLNKESKISNSFIKEEENTITYKVTQVFLSNDKRKTFVGVADLKKYLDSNPNNANGVYHLYINDIIVYKSDVVNGVKVNEKTYETTTSLTSKYPCTYEGVRKCAVDRIDNMNWLDTWSCIGEGLNCVLYQMASCAIDNC